MKTVSELKVISMPKKSTGVNELLDRVKGMNLKNLVCITEETGTDILLMNSGLPMERINWMLDRAKMALHEDE